MLDHPNSLEEAAVITEYLLKHGYSDTDIKKVIGGSWKKSFLVKRAKASETSGMPIW